jgi:hypothetical protein
MVLLEDMLKEEIVNSERRKHSLEVVLKDLPKGCFVKKRINGRLYNYQAHWVPSIKKMKFDYIPNEKFEEVSAATIKRKKLENQLKMLNLQIQFLRKAIHARAFKLAHKYSGVASQE